MPRNNRTEPKSQGPGIGKQMGRGDGQGRGGGLEVSPGRYCICLNCGTRGPHPPGMPCFKIRCPKCGFPMTEELI